MIFNPLESGLHLWNIKKKGNQFTFFESLARLAYNKGTALFRGNDPLQRSAAETFSLIINTSSQTHLTCFDMAQTRNGDRNMAKATHVQYMPTDEHISHEGLVLQKRILCYQPVHWREVTCYLSLTVAVEFYFSYKAAEITELWSKLQKITALSQKECDKEVKRWDRPVLYYFRRSSSGCSLCGYHLWNQAVRNNTEHHSQRTSL